MTARTTYAVVENDPDQDSSAQIRHATLNAANIDATLLLISNLQASIEAVIQGAISKQTVQALEQAFAFVAPPQAAQRELKWFVGGVDGFGNAQRMTIPTADTAFVVSGGSAMVDGAERAALTADIEALWRSNADSPVQVTEIKLVGRTS